MGMDASRVIVRKKPGQRRASVHTCRQVGRSGARTRGRQPGGGTRPRATRPSTRGGGGCSVNGGTCLIVPARASLCLRNRRVGQRSSATSSCSRWRCATPRGSAGCSTRSPARCSRGSWSMPRPARCTGLVQRVHDRVDRRRKIDAHPNHFAGGPHLCPRSTSAWRRAAVPAPVGLGAAVVARVRSSYDQDHLQCIVISPHHRLPWPC
jgi:hypothetical protein